MDKKAKFRFVFDRLKDIEKRRKPDGLIQIEVYQEGVRKFISTGIRIKSKEWDARRGLVKGERSDNYNKMLKRQLKGLEDFEADTVNFTLGKLDSFIKDGGRKRTFLEFYEELWVKDNKLAGNTHRAQGYTLNVLKEFKRICFFKDLTYENIEAFDTFLHDKGLAQSTIWGHHKQVKVYINKAIKRRLFNPQDNPYLDFKSTLPKSSRNALSEDELKQIEEVQFGDGFDLMFENVRDMFLFSCYTGLRFNDVKSLLPEQFVEDQSGLNLTITTQKASKKIILPLGILFNGKPDKIARKWLKWANSSVFFGITNQHANRILKTITKKAGMSREITYHYSRHTFGTLLANYTGDPILIKDFMGHSKIQTSMEYIHLSQKQQQEKLKKIKW